MNKLFLVRHAKSSWNNAQLRDFERPLNKRGIRDAPFMGNLLSKKEIKPDLLISSPAKRAKFTAKYFAKELNYPEEKILYKENLYEAGINDLIKIVSEIDNTNRIVILFAHNPGLTDFSNFISDKYIDNIPTAGVVALNPGNLNWNQVGEKTCELEFFDYPKKYFK